MSKNGEYIEAEFEYLVVGSRDRWVNTTSTILKDHGYWLSLGLPLLAWRTWHRRVK